jgi:hypothetical protein
VRVERIETLIELFVKKAKRDRMRALAGKPSRRADLRHDLLHDRRSLDSALLVALGSGDTASTIARALRDRGAGNVAYCICDADDLDDRDVPLDDALARIVGRERDAIVHPIGARVAYYENHEGERYLLWHR